MMHYYDPKYIKKDDGSWKIEAPCGFAICAPGHNMTQYTTTVLDELTCERCREIYALEILAQLP